MARPNHGIVLNQNIQKTWKQVDYRWIQLSHALPKLWNDHILKWSYNEFLYF